MSAFITQHSFATCACRAVSNHDVDALNLSVDVAAVGSDMLSDEFKRTQVQSEPDTGYLSLSEGDFDLREGQPKKNIPPPPDISQLKLDD